MAGTTIYSRHALEIVKGPTNIDRPDIDARLSANVTRTGGVPAGRCVHLNEDGEWELGIGSLTTMAYFLRDSSYASDVAYGQDVGGDPEDEVNAYVIGVPVGRMTALPATFPGELESTEYDPEEDYPPGTPLTSTANNSSADGGLLVPGEFGTDTIVGIVTNGIVTDPSTGVRRVSFQPTFAPPQS